MLEFSGRGERVGGIRAERQGGQTTGFLIEGSS